jgi:hypothetical protein
MSGRGIAVGSTLIAATAVSPRLPGYVRTLHRNSLSVPWDENLIAHSSALHVQSSPQRASVRTLGRACARLALSH